jgi:hypothetical protein
MNFIMEFYNFPWKNHLFLGDHEKIDLGKKWNDIAAYFVHLILASYLVFTSATSMPK